MIIHKNIPNKPGIYRIYDSKKSYIGASINIKNRLIKHRSYLKNNCHSNKFLQRCYNLDSNEIKIEILKIFNKIDIELLLDYETHYHILYDSIENGFNIDYPRRIQERYSLTSEQINKAVSTKIKPILAFNRFTGKLDFKFNSITEAANKVKGSTSNISKVCKGNLNHMYGYVFCYVENFDSSKIYSFPYDHKKGKPHTKEHLEKLKESSARAKKIYKYDLNHNLIQEYYSRSEAERQNNFKKEFLRNRLKTPLEGYIYTHTKI